METALPMTLRRLLEAGLSIFDGQKKSYTGDYPALTGNKLNIRVTFFFQERRERAERAVSERGLLSLNLASLFA